MNTEITITEREWSDFRNEGPDGVIGKLNTLLRPHGVTIMLASPAEYPVELMAFSPHEKAIDDTDRPDMDEIRDMRIKTDKLLRSEEFPKDFRFPKHDRP